MKPIHVFADLRECRIDFLLFETSESFHAEIRNRISKISVILDERWHVFDNDAYTAVFLLADSHFSIHTWPEKKFANFDLFTCGSVSPVEQATELAKCLSPNFAENGSTFQIHSRDLKSDFLYVIRPGDNLSTLAQKFLGSYHRWKELADHNSIEDPYRIFYGETIKIPIDKI